MHSTKTFEEWGDVPAPKRGSIIMKIGDALRNNKVNLGRLVTIEAGKTKTEGEGIIQINLPLRIEKNDYARSPILSIMIIARSISRFMFCDFPLLLSAFTDSST